MARLARWGYGLRAAASVAGLLLAAWCAPSLAASGVEIDCPEAAAQRALTAAAIAAPALSVTVADHGVDSSAGIDDELIDPARVAPTVPPAEQVDGDPDDAAAPREDIPPTATRLPGVSESDLPRFRRQMLRTDI